MSDHPTHDQTAQDEVVAEVRVPADPPTEHEPQATRQPAGERAAAPLAGKLARRQCPETTKAGKPCPVAPYGTYPRCLHHQAPHSPELMAMVHAGRVAGGKVARQTLGIELQADMATPESIRATLERVADAVAGGRMASAAGDVVVRAARVAVDVHAHETEVRLQELLAAVQRMQERGVR